MSEYRTAYSDLMTLMIQALLNGAQNNEEIREKLKETFEKLSKSYDQGLKCDVCGARFNFWIVPREWWEKVSEELQKKNLCFTCYLTDIGLIRNDWKSKSMG